MCGLVAARVNLPAKFANIGNAVRPRLPHADFDFAHGAKRVGLVGKIIRADFLQQSAGVWPHNGKHGLGSGYIGDHHKCRCQMPPEPSKVSLQGRPRYHQQKHGFRKAGDGEVALDAAALV